MRQRQAERNRLAERSHRTDLVVHALRDVDRNVSSVTFGPTLLPEVAGHFGHFGDPACQFGPIF